MRAVIVETIKENVNIIIRHLPPGITVARQHEPFDRHSAVELRLEGDGLPPWCVTKDGCFLMRGTLDILADGTVRITPGCGMPVQQIADGLDTSSGE